MYLKSSHRILPAICLFLLALAAGCTLPGHFPVIAHAFVFPSARGSSGELPAPRQAAPAATIAAGRTESGTDNQRLAAAVAITATRPAPAALPLAATEDAAQSAAALAAAAAAPDSGAPGPNATPDGLARTIRVPILMYHYISQPPADADIYRKDLSVPPDRFESHLAYLRDHGFHVVSLDDVRAAMLQGQALPDKPVVLTFDDGYQDNYTNAFPLLKKYGMAGYFFILTDVTTEGRTGYMTWPEIEEMAAAGQHIGAHGRNHLQAFRGKSRDFLVWHALGTSEAIKQHLGYHPRWVAYPTGAYDDLTMEVFRSAGFVGGLSTEPGATHRPDTLFHLSRVRVHGNFSADDLARFLNAS